MRLRPEAGRFWKDLVVNLLQEIEIAPQKAAIDLDSKGEMEHITYRLGGRFRWAVQRVCV
jgi:hypothetical protein